MPDLSVVIPTIGRPAVLKRTLERLAHQRLGELTIEVLVVSDAASPAQDATARVVAERGPAMRHLVGEWDGASASRNVGWQAARAPLVLFLGDDMLAVPELLAIHVDTHRSHTTEADAVLGSVRWARELRVTPFMRWLERGIAFDYASLDAGRPPGWGDFYTSNVSVKRSLLERVGGFDEEAFPFRYEDLDIARRMHDAIGLRLHYRPKAAVEHLHPTSIDAWRKRMRENALAEHRFVERYRDVRPYFHDRFVAALARPAPRGRAARLARFVGPRFPWVGRWVWESVDAYYTRVLAEEFMTGWEAAGPPVSCAGSWRRPR